MENTNTTWWVGITTAPRSPPTLAATLASLTLAGWGQTFISHDCGKELGPYGNLRLVLRVGVDHFCQLSQRYNAGEHGNEYILVCQDDIEITPNLRNYLDSPGNHLPTDGISSLYTPANLHHPTQGWHATTTLPRSYGALAIAFPLPIACEFCKSPLGENKTHQADFWITKFCHEHNIPYYTHSPSFVRHTGEISSLDEPNNNSHLRQCAEFCTDVTALSTPQQHRPAVSENV